MAKFSYRMQNILVIKTKMEDQAKSEYATCRMRLAEEEEKLEQLYQKQQMYEEQAVYLLSSRLDVLMITENKNSILHTEELINTQKVQIHMAEQALERARVKLQGYMQERKTHERLREKAFETFLREENARESKEIDELTSYTYGQKVRNETENI